MARDAIKRVELGLAGGAAEVIVSIDEGVTHISVLCTPG
jgi:hypothetical protein